MTGMKNRSKPRETGRKTTRRFLRSVFGAALMASGISSGSAVAGSCSNSQYGGTDIDCAIILCLVAGFGPSECKPAYSCFWHRLTRVPPKPPIGFCPMGSMTNLTLADDGKDVLKRTLRELESFNYPEGADSIRSVSATIYRSTSTCSRGGKDGESYPCTATYFVNADGSKFRRSNIEGHFRGKKIEYVDGFGVERIVGDAEQKVSVPYNCYTQGQGDGRVCSYRSFWKPIARPIE